MTTKYYKHPKFGHLYGSALPTPVGRACWPALVTPKDPPPPQEGQAPGQPRYEMTLLLDKADLKVVKFLEDVKAMTDEMLVQYNEGKKAQIASVSTIVDGDLFDMDKYPFYKGMWVLTARNTQKPQVVDYNESRKPLVIDSSSIIGGMRARMVVTPLITAHGVSYKLSVAQFVSDDNIRFGGGSRDMVSFLDAISDVPGDVPATEASEPVAIPVTSAGVVAVVPEPTVAQKGKKAALDLL